MPSYDEFLKSKKIVDQPSGMELPLSSMNGYLFDFQASLVKWALSRGRAGLFTGTGTGKTSMALAWAEHVPGRVLILAPLAVTQQTMREAQKMGLPPVQYVRSKSDMSERVCITNYDMAESFVGVEVEGIVLDEASIIKHFSSATRNLLIKEFRQPAYRLCCTATPAPNSTEEIGNYAEWLGVMTLNDMRSTFFVHDENGWRLMEHAREAFYEWLASWAMTLRGPADIGFDGSRFELPPLNIVEHFLPWDGTRLLADGDGQMGIPGMNKLHGITDRVAVRKQTIQLRAKRAAEIARETSGQLVIWVGLSDEGKAIMDLLGSEAVEVKGSDKREDKERSLVAFLDGKKRILVTKASIAGFGINMQCASDAIFLGMNDSWESYYQAVRRLWRYGQKNTVNTHIVMSEHERPIWDNVKKKEREANMMIDGLIESVKSYEQDSLSSDDHAGSAHSIEKHMDKDWSLYHGDCIEGMRNITDKSVDLTIYSPPFANLFSYHPSSRDVGNCLGEEQFFAHHSYVADQLLRIMKPGRLIAMHVMEVPAMLVRDGWIGLKNFRGHMVDHMMEKGFVHAGEVTCAKSPQAQAIRIRAKGLAFHQVHKDSSWSRPCLGDYILLFKSPGENDVPVTPDIDNETWIIWAANIWLSQYYDSEDGYSETRSLNVSEGRDMGDTKHICPLPLDLVERCIRLWSNPGEVCLDPFSGLGTVGVKALEHGRKYVGCELKDSYVAAQLKNLARAKRYGNQQVLF